MSVADHQYWLGLQGYSAQAPTIEPCQCYFRHRAASFPGRAPATLFIATIMSKESGCHDRQVVLALNICGLLYDLGQLTYNGIKPKLEYWIEYVLTKQFAMVDDPVERVLPVAWDTHSSHSDISRFLKEFRKTPHRSEQARSFVNRLCLHVLQWFAVASAEGLWVNWDKGLASERGGPGFIRTALFVGHLIEYSLLSRELVQQHILKPLTNHYYNQDNFKKQSIRANAIHQLFTAAGNTLLQGFLKPKEVQDCFRKLETRVLLRAINQLDALDTARLDVRCNYCLNTRIGI